MSLITPEPYQLSPELEALWQEMNTLRQHPNYHAALDRLPQATAESCNRLLAVPRVWLADGRTAQVREAMRHIQAAL